MWATLNARSSFQGDSRDGGELLYRAAPRAQPARRSASEDFPASVGRQQNPQPGNSAPRRSPDARVRVRPRAPEGRARSGPRHSGEFRNLFGKLPGL